MNNLSFEILQLYSSRSSLSLLQLGAILNKDAFNLAEPINYLRAKDYLKIEPNHAMLNSLSDKEFISLDTPLVITYLGKIAIESEAKERQHFKFTEFRAWVTLAIALIALILSIVI